MDVWKVIDSAETVDGDDLVLSRKGDEWQVHTGPTLLMSSHDHHSEDALSTLAIERAGKVQRMLIGGLGMGFTLRAALEALPATAEVVLAETSETLLHWNRTELAYLARHPLDDARLSVVLGSVADRIGEAHESYDVIALDVDNGPEALVHRTNDSLYNLDGSRAAFRALRPGGVLAVWARWPNDEYVESLREVGFEAEAVSVPGPTPDFPRYTIFLGRRPG